MPQPEDTPMLNHGCARMVALSTALFMGCAMYDADAQDKPADANPAVLFATPKSGDMSHAWVDWTWLRELHDSGFEVDVTCEGGLAELTWERIRQFNVLFLYASPDALQRQWRGMPSDPAKIEAFQSLLKRFTAAGGGLFLMPSGTNIRKQVLADATTLMDARLPAEAIVESNAANRGYLSHCPRPVPLAWTDGVQPSPVSAGVGGVWYPFREVYVASMMNPLVLGPDWTVVLRASATAHSVPVRVLRDSRRTGGYDIHELEGLFYREAGEKQPALFGIREWNGGRVALCPMWRMFSVANGTQWIFNREVLSRGLRNRPSDFGRLLRNTLRWLAAPSLGAADASVGGYRTPEGCLAPLNERPGAFERFNKSFAVGKFDNKPPERAPLFKGLIGARTARTSGAGTVGDYAVAAREAGLGYVVFLEDLSKLTPESWQAFSTECQDASGSDLLLIPGYSGRNNVGNFTFMFGQGLPFPPESALRRDDAGRCVFYLQKEDGQGRLVSGNTPLFSWILDVAKRFQVGYGDFASSPDGMRMDQLRLCGMVAVDFYRDGTLVESLPDDYLTTAQGTIPPSPAAVNRVDSPEALLRETAAGRGLTYAQGASLETLFKEALHYTCTYDGANVFPSSGPLIEAWPACARAMTFGAEEFVVEANVMRAPLRVRADAGLKEVALYNGRALYRRFLPNGATTFAADLVLDRTVQKNLVAVVTDMNGGRAVSFRRGSWKSGSNSPEFCSDHINDMITISMARGPFAVPFVRPPMLPESVGGWTWDGGPKGIRAFGERHNPFPELSSDQGRESAKSMLQTPLLLAADELSFRVASERRGGMYGAEGRTVFNPWKTFGPERGTARLFTCDLRYAEWTQPMLSVKPGGWGFGCERGGIIPGIWTADVTYHSDQTVKQLQMLTMTANLEVGPSPAFVVLGDDLATSIDLASLTAPRRVKLPRGTWMGLYSSRVMNAHIFFNRGADLLIELGPTDLKRKFGPTIAFLADNEGTAVTAGQRETFELGVVNFPVNCELRGPADVRRYADYLTSCPGLELRRGTREPSPGVLEIAADDGVVDVAVPRGDAPAMVSIPLLATGLNPRWSAAALQREGYVKGYYGPGTNRWRPLAVAGDGSAMVPLFVTLAERTDIAVGHPIVADARGRDLFIQVTRTASEPAAWHVSVNNPTDAPVAATLRQALPAPGLDVGEQTVELAPGEYRVLVSDDSVEE